jgi:hypothetical protein
MVAKGPRRKTPPGVRGSGFGTRLNRSWRIDFLPHAPRATRTCPSSSGGRGSPWPASGVGPSREHERKMKRRVARGQRNAWTAAFDLRLRVGEGRRSPCSYTRISSSSVYSQSRRQRATQLSRSALSMFSPMLRGVAELRPPDETIKPNNAVTPTGGARTR